MSAKTFVRLTFVEEDYNHLKEEADIFTEVTIFL